VKGKERKRKGASGGLRKTFYKKFSLRILSKISIGGFLFAGLRQTKIRFREFREKRYKNKPFLVSYD